MSKTMLVNVVTEEESRIALVSDGVLEELSIETARQEQIEGNIYKARIVKVIPSLDAVFVDYGRERNGFLAVPDIHHQYFGNDKRSSDGLRKGQDLMVQVKKGEIGQKGAALTTYISLPGRYFVLMPQVSKRGVSRRIQKDSTRDQLRKILDDSGIPDEMGYIARTAAEGRTKQELTRDASYLLRLWKNVQEQHKTAKGPSLLYQETDIVIRTLRDYFTPAIAEVLVDDEEIYNQVRSFFQAVMPWHTKRVRLHQAKSPLFSKYNLEDQIATIHEKRVPLPSGGSLVIEQTEALVSIDVNSGKTTKGKDIEETALIANNEAAEEAARQLRLRDMGGLVVIDFIDMRGSSHRNQVRKVLQKALKEDKARTETGTISKFGLLELSRQRLKGVARAADIQACPLCSGAGKVRSVESAALAALRRLQLRLSRKGVVRQVLLGVPLPVANLLLNRKRNRLAELESRFGTEILIFPEPPLAANQYYLEYRTDKDPQIDCNLPEDFNRALLLAPKGLPDAPPRPARPSLYELHGEEEESGQAEAEVPEEPGDEQDAAPQEAAEERRSGSKRRRGRRRRRPGDETTEQKKEEQPAPAADTSSTEPAAPAAAEQETPEDRSEEEAEQGSSRRMSPSAKRRLRRKRAAAASRAEKGSADGDTRAQEAQTSTSEQKSAPTEDPAAADAAATAEAEETRAADRTGSLTKTGTPRRSRRAGAKGKTSKSETGKAPAEQKPAPETETAAEQQSSKPQSIAAAAEEAASKRSAKPRRRRKPKADSSAEQAKTDVGEAAEGAASSAPSDTGTAVPSSGSDTAEKTDAPQEPKQKPARKAPRKSKTGTEASSAAPSAAPSAETGSDAPAKKPVRRPRKKPTAAGSSKPEAPDTEEDAKKPKPAPKRRPRTRKTTAGKKDEGAVESAGSKAGTEEDPGSGSAS